MSSKSTMDHISSINRSAKLLAERSKMSYVVEMVMGHKDCRKGIHVQTILKKCLFKSPQAHTRINEYSTIGCTEVVAVAAATAGETHELYFIIFHLHNISLSHRRHPALQVLPHAKGRCIPSPYPSNR